MKAKFGPSKIQNYHLANVIKKKSHLILLFHYSKHI